MVKTPYLVITGVFLFVALLIFLTKLPEIRETSAEGQEASDAKLSGTFAFPHLIKGVIAQFFYVGAQVGVASFIIRFTEFTLPGTHEKAAAHYLQAHLAGFMIGRFAGSAIMQKVAAPRAAQLVCRRIAALPFGRPVRLGCCAGLGDCVDRLFSLHHVPNNFRPEPEEPGPLHQARIFPARHGHHRRRGLPLDHGHGSPMPGISNARSWFHSSVMLTFSISRCGDIGPPRSRTLATPLAIPATEVE